MKKLTIFFTILMAMVITCNAQWQRHTIDPDIYFTTIIEVEDIEDDGDLDLVVGHYGSNMLLLYENNTLYNTLIWSKDTIDDFFPGIVGVDIADFDNDGKMDIVAAGYQADLVAWYKNDGGDPINWIKDTIDNLDGANAVYAEDLNGDGTPDAVANAYFSGDIICYENNLPSGWTSHIISANWIHPECMEINDVNNDGKPDVVAAANGSNTVVLYINNLPDTNWTEIIIDGNLPDVFWPSIADIDNDGYADIVVAGQAASGDDADIAWYENDGSGLIWTKHTIAIGLSKSRSVAITNMYNDDYLDVVANDFLGQKIILYKNEDGGQNWDPYIIDDNITQPNCVFSADLDLDNDFDILVTLRNSFGLYWYENPYLISSDNEELLEDTRIYPNPTNGLLNIEINTTNKKGIEIEIFSITGNIVYQQENKNWNEGFIKQIDLSSFTKGLYLVKIKQASAVLIRKVIVD